MPVIDDIADLCHDATLWRRDFHAHPELMYDVHRTANVVARQLESFGCDAVETGIGQTGVVGVIRGRRKSGDATKVIGMRADMDALPIMETTGLQYQSITPGRMHACGHDGHTAMLLAAARHLAETRNFSGTAVVIFQPAEEGGAGAKAMLDDGLIERFGIQEVYGMHNLPGLDAGKFGLRAGPAMASADMFRIDIDGVGGHGAWPHITVDPLLVGAHIVTLCQSIVSRNVDPLEGAVISITMFHGGDANNVIPDSVHLQGTARSLTAATRQFLHKRMTEIVEGTAKLHGAKARLTWQSGYPVTFNHPEQAALAVAVAREVAGDSQVTAELAPMMSTEDFSFMLEARPGAYIFIGNGASAGWHHPAYDFNDQVIPLGASYWIRLAERALA